MIKKFYLLLLFSFFNMNFFLFAETEGEKAFRENQPNSAILNLENEIKNENVTSNTYNFLGLAYYQTENYEKSIEAFQNGLQKNGVNKVILYFNLGNAYFMNGNITEAVKSYEEAVKIDKNYSSAFLNKANCEVSIGFYESAISDYEEYLSQKPEDVQRPQIEDLIKLLREVVRVQKENERLAEEQRKAEEEAERAAMEQPISDEIENDLQELAKRDAEENQKLEDEKNSLVNQSVITDTDIDLPQAVEEDEMLQQAIAIENERVQKEKEEQLKQKQAEEEMKKQQLEEELELQKEEENRTADENSKKNESERRRKLLEDIANSLQNSDDQNINSGSGDIIEYEYESELE